MGQPLGLTSPTLVYMCIKTLLVVVSDLVQFPVQPTVMVRRISSAVLHHTTHKPPLEDSYDLDGRVGCGLLRFAHHVVRSPPGDICANRALITFKGGHQCEMHSSRLLAELATTRASLEGQQQHAQKWEGSAPSPQLNSVDG